jgi:hypothetical protein
LGKPPTEEGYREKKEKKVPRNLVFPLEATNYNFILYSSRYCTVLYFNIGEVAPARNTAMNW